MFKTIIAYSMFILLMPAAVVANECSDFNSPIKNVIYYVNGVQNSVRDMQAASAAIRSAMGNLSENRYRVAENRSDGITKDFYQAYLNRVNAPDSEDFWRQVRSEDPSLLDEEARRLYSQAITSAATVELSRSADLREMILDFVRDLESGKKVILVSHSQGNFYANAAYRHIADTFPSLKESIGIVAVASPAPIVEGNGLLTQNADDSIIFGVVDLLFPVLPANVNFKGSDAPDHGFLTTYMLPQNAKARIVSQIRQMIDRLVEPLSTCDESVGLVEARPIKNLKALSVELNARLIQGKNAKAWFVYRKGASSIKCSDSSRSPEVDVSAVSDLSYSAVGLKSKSTYYYRACARGQDSVVRSTPVKIFSTPANIAKISRPRQKDATRNTLTAEATIIEGERVTTGFVLTQDTTVPHTCNMTNRDGTFFSGDISQLTFRNLKPNTQYKVTSCALASDSGNHFGGSQIFRTNNVPVLNCGRASFRGGSTGLAVRYNLGGGVGRSSIYFNAFQIPDGLRIFRTGTSHLLFTTNGLISGSFNSSFLATGSDQVDVIVTGNSDSRTEWELVVECPR